MGEFPIFQLHNYGNRVRFGTQNDRIRHLPSSSKMAITIILKGFGLNFQFLSTNKDNTVPIKNILAALLPSSMKVETDVILFSLLPNLFFPFHHI